MITALARLRLKGFDDNSLGLIETEGWNMITALA